MCALDYRYNLDGYQPTAADHNMFQFVSYKLLRNKANRRHRKRGNATFLIEMMNIYWALIFLFVSQVGSENGSTGSSTTAPQPTAATPPTVRNTTKPATSPSPQTTTTTTRATPTTTAPRATPTTTAPRDTPTTTAPRDTPTTTAPRATPTTTAPRATPTTTAPRDTPTTTAPRDTPTTTAPRATPTTTAPRDTPTTTAPATTTTVKVTTSSGDSVPKSATQATASLQAAGGESAAFSVHWEKKHLVWSACLVLLLN
ncbi:unnamed protein product [Dicrocoelium dendriticum]|nr:unnamed protein product [Dicrocoelium dendriticum]